LTRIAVAAFWAGIVGVAMAVVAMFWASFPQRESLEIGALGALGAAIYVLYFL
jgi:hypothetical protein